MALGRIALLLSIMLVQSAEPTWESRLQEAGEAWAAGDYSAAGDAFEAALTARPAHPIALLNLAMARARQGDLDAAFAALDELAATGLSFPVPERDWLVPLMKDPRFVDAAGRLAANAEPSGEALDGFSLSDRALFPEGIAWDPERERFWISSVRHGALVETDGQGRELRRIDAIGAGWGIFGLGVGPSGSLWAAASVIEHAIGFEESAAGQFALLQVDPESGRILRRAEPAPGHAAGLLGDVIVTPDGTCWATDSVGGALYRLAPGADELEAFLPPGTFASPQGLVTIADGMLIVADYASGLYRVDTVSAAVSPVQPARNLAPYGIDGLAGRGGRIWAVQNGMSPYRVLELELAPDGRSIGSWRTLVSGDPRMGEPTLAVLRHDELWVIANSPWPQFSDPGNPPALEDLPLPIVLRIPVSPR
jgi:sugar lactone lactonase YvrE